MRNKKAPESYELYKKIRSDWGVLNPSTKIIQNKKKYNRKEKYKKKFDFN